MPCVLVVDDDEDIRDAIADALRDEGYDVHTATDGADALVEMRTAPPCVVVLDLMMPVMDGWSVVREMQADPRLAAVPVCIVSAMADQAPPSSACVLRKPLRLDALLAMVEASCGPGA